MRGGVAAGGYAAGRAVRSLSAAQGAESGLVLLLEHRPSSQFEAIAGNGMDLLSKRIIMRVAGTQEMRTECRVMMWVRSGVLRVKTTTQTCGMDDFGSRFIYRPPAEIGFTMGNWPQLLFYLFFTPLNEIKQLRAAPVVRSRDSTGTSPFSLKI